MSTEQREQHAGEWLGTGDAARLLDLSADRVRSLEREGRLPAVRTPAGVRLFRRVDVEALAARRAEADGSK